MRNITPQVIKIIIFTIAAFNFSPALAHFGWWRVEAHSVNADFGDIDFSSSDNSADHVKTIDALANIDGEQWTTYCEGHSIINHKIYSWGKFPPGKTIIYGNRSYLNINKYVNVAVGYQVSGSALSWIPFDRVKIGNNPGDKCNKTYHHKGHTSFDIALQVKKPFVGYLPINSLVGYIYTGDGAGTALKHDARQEIYLSGNIYVPQSCELDAGTIINIDFGNIGAAQFSQAGAGNKPASVNPKTHSIAVKCKNIDAQALLSMRLEADNVSGHALVSDNKDVGFIVANSNKKPLTPNNVDSKIEFQLDDNSAAIVPITAWPVSITGIKPAEGKFTAEGYLRIDFD